MRKRLLIAAVVGLLAAGLALAWANLPIEELPEGFRADRVEVHKKDRVLHLIRNDRIARTYRVSLGANPEGHKQREGDERTPEGRYAIDYRKEDSSFHLALHISYPDSRDRAAAKSRGEDPGGLIMIHGLPNRLPFLGRLHRWFDWTDGCVAVTNREIEQIWNSVDVGTPIDLFP